MLIRYMVGVGMYKWGRGVSERGKPCSGRHDATCRPGLIATKRGKPRSGDPGLGFTLLQATAASGAL